MKQHVFHCYEDFAWVKPRVDKLDLSEGFDPARIVGWHQTIRDKILELWEKEKAQGDAKYAVLLYDFFNVWENNPITANMNIEDIKALIGPAQILADSPGSQSSYFRGVVMSLKELEASISRPDTGGAENPENAPMAGGAGASMPPIGGDFGPQEEEPNAPGIGEEPSAGAEQPNELPGEPAPGGEEEGAPGRKPPLPKPPI